MREMQPTPLYPPQAKSARLLEMQQSYIVTSPSFQSPAPLPVALLSLIEQLVNVALPSYETMQPPAIQLVLPMIRQFISSALDTPIHNPAPSPASYSESPEYLYISLFLLCPFPSRMVRFLSTAL